jgi:hypothetical protein
MSDEKPGEKRPAFCSFYGLIQEPALSSPVPIKTSAFGSMTGAGAISMVAGCDIAAARAAGVATCGRTVGVAGMNDPIATTEPNTVRIVANISKRRFVIEASRCFDGTTMTLRRYRTISALAKSRYIRNAAKGRGGAGSQKLGKKETVQRERIEL